MRLILTTLTTLILAATLIAQTPGRRGPRGDGERPERGERGPRLEQLSEYLSLTDEQRTAIGEVLTSRRTAARENMQAVAAKHREAMEELRSESPNAGLVGQLLVEAKEMRGAAKGTEDETIAQIRAVLNPTQQEQLSRLTSMVEYQREIREAQALGLLPNEEGEFNLGGDRGRRGGPGQRGPRGPRGRGGFGGPGANAFAR